VVSQHEIDRRSLLAKPIREKNLTDLHGRLICEYERTLDRIEKELDDGRFDVALELAALPGAVRGFGPIKLAAVERYEDARLELLDRWATATRTGTLTESGEQVAPRVLHGASARS
jgi:hypothetical protein